MTNSARDAGAAANHVSANKNAKYSQLSSTQIFLPVANSGLLVELVQERHHVQIAVSFQHTFTAG